jgi:hypothetical protein
MTVLVERSFTAPVELADIQQIAQRGTWCLQAHSVRFLQTLFARDRRRMICLYEAADAESVRHVQREAGLPFELAWSARRIRYAAGGPAAGTLPVVVERLLPTPFAEEDVRRLVEAKAWCLEQYGCRILESYLGLDGARMVCRFEAPDAESVRAAQRSAEMPLHAVWPATIHQAAA